MLRYGIMGTNLLSHIYFDAIHAAGDQVAAVCSRSLERAWELGSAQPEHLLDPSSLLCFRNP